MTPRQKRLTLVLGIIAGVSVAGALALNAFRNNVTFFFDPTAVAAGQVPAGERFRLGGMVTKGSVQRAPGSLEDRFVVTDFKHDVPVSYTGVLPDLFREGQGVVAHGRMTGGTFVADEVLAKHDEKYMPPEVARSLKKRQAEGAAPGGPPGSAATPSGGAGGPMPAAGTTSPGAAPAPPTAPAGSTPAVAAPSTAAADSTHVAPAPDVAAGSSRPAPQTTVAQTSPP